MLHNCPGNDTIQSGKALSPQDIQTINKALDAGFLVELMKLRDGTIKAKTVKKKEISLPTAH